MKKKVLSFEERLKHDGATHVFEITHEDLTETTANTAQALELLTTPASRCSVECKKAVLVTPLEDESDAAFNTNALIVGDSSNDDRLLESMELNENGTEVLKKVGTAVKYVYTAATAVNATFAAMADKALNDIDAGEVHIYLCVESD